MKEKDLLGLSGDSIRQGFTFSHHYNDPDDTIGFSSNNKQVHMNLYGEHSVPQLLNEFLCFLKACGYCFKLEDTLQVVNDFDEEISLTDLGNEVANCIDESKDDYEDHFQPLPEDQQYYSEQDQEEYQQMVSKWKHQDGPQGPEEESYKMYKGANGAAGPARKLVSKTDF
jgi:hypothetical protein